VSEQGRASLVATGLSVLLSVLVAALVAGWVSTAGSPVVPVAQGSPSGTVVRGGHTGSKQATPHDGSNGGSTAIVHVPTGSGGSVVAGGSTSSSGGSLGSGSGGSGGSGDGSGGGCQRCGLLPGDLGGNVVGLLGGVAVKLRHIGKTRLHADVARAATSPSSPSSGGRPASGRRAVAHASKVGAHDVARAVRMVIRFVRTHWR
jgi:hypothetical protein